MKEVSPEATKLRLVISPELALVDPELRARAVAALGGEERWTCRAPPPPPVTAHPSRAVAALAYLAVAIVHTLAVEAAFAALVVLVVLILALSS
jgi:hypothetical protein